MSRVMVITLGAVLVLACGCSRVSTCLEHPMGDYRLDGELKAQYLNKTAHARGDLVDAKTGEVVFPTGTLVTVEDIRFRPMRFPKATGEVVLAGADGRQLKLGFTSRFKEHFVLQLESVLAFDGPPVAEALPLRMTVAEERAVRIAVLKKEFADVPLWLVCDVPCVQGSGRSYLPAGTEVRLVDGSVIVSERAGGEEILSRLFLSDGEGSTVVLYLQPPRRSYAEWYDQMAVVVTTEERVPTPEMLPKGLGRDAVLSAWGPPDRRRGHLSRAGVREEWTYAVRGQTLVFENGKLAGR